MATRSLFEALCVTLLPENLDKLSNVARHFGSHVRKLYYDCDVLNDQYKTYSQWEKAADLRRPHK